MEDVTSGSLHRGRRIRCIVKLGGAAITFKNEVEKINEENLQKTCSQLKHAVVAGSSSPMTSEIVSCNRSGELDEHSLLECSHFVVVHGAGSFGHFQASQSGVHKGGLNQLHVKAGFASTRISVASLNLEVVRSLNRAGIPSVGLSPFSCGWSTSKRNLISADLSTVIKTIDSGLVPVLHGDAVLDDVQGCAILSGDIIVHHIAASLKPKYVVFLTDVLGVYDRPPSDPNAVLVREIGVGRDGSWSILKPACLNNNKTSMQVAVSVMDRDTTGGMLTKISEAAMIAKHGINVYIVKAATGHSQRALCGELGDLIADDWAGTLFHLVED